MFVPSAPLAPSGEGASSYAARAGHQVRQRLDFVNWSGLGESQLLVGATFRLVDQPVAGNRAHHRPNEAFTAVLVDDRDDIHRPPVEVGWNWKSTAH